MEAAGLALSAVPLVVGALKAYRDVYAYFRIFQHYAVDIRTLFVRFKAQQLRLEHELDHILLQAGQADLRARGLSSLGVADLIAQPNSSSTGSLATLEGKRLVAERTIRAVLRSSEREETFQSLLLIITEQLKDLHDELKCFEALRKQQFKDESMKQTILRVRARIKIGFDKRRLQALLDDLRNDNEDLHCLVASISASQVDAPLHRKQVKGMPEEILRSRSAISALHETLRLCWSCVNPNHADHIAKLCLGPLQTPETKQPAEIRLDLAVACMPKSTPTPPQIDPIWMYVRTLTEVSASVNTSPQCLGTTAGPSSTVGSASATQRSVCDSLSKCPCKNKRSEACASWDHPGKGFRHLIYHHCTPPSTIRKSNRSMSLAEVLPDIRLELSMEQQLALSRRLALSILELHNSPWLTDQWRIEDIATFAKPSLDDNIFVEQLHVTSAISKPTAPPAILPSALWPVSSGTDAFLEFVLSSVGNRALFSLGVAMLELAHGKPLEHFRQGTDEYLIMTAQRLALRTCPLGERYRKVAQQCLRCDFACGTNLELFGLQDAVYSDVVGQLEELMVALRP